MHGFFKNSSLTSLEVSVLSSGFCLPIVLIAATVVTNESVSLVSISFVHMVVVSVSGFIVFVLVVVMVVYACALSPVSGYPVSGSGLTFPVVDIVVYHVDCVFFPVSEFPASGSVLLVEVVTSVFSALVVLDGIVSVVVGVVPYVYVLFCIPFLLNLFA